MPVSYLITCAFANRRHPETHVLNAVLRSIDETRKRARAEAFACASCLLFLSMDYTSYVKLQFQLDFLWHLVFV